MDSRTPVRHAWRDTYYVRAATRPTAHPRHPLRALSPAVVAIARRGGIDVLTNEVSKRLTACMVGFSGKERKLGEAALSGVRALPPPAVRPAAASLCTSLACSRYWRSPNPAAAP